MARIRLAEGPDAEALAAIYRPFVETTAVSFETDPPGEDEMRQRVHETTAAYPWLVLEVEGRVLGYAYATRHRVRGAYRWSVDTSVYVDSTSRRRGIGRALYVSLFGILRAQGFFNAYAGITLPNAASVGLHEAVGFKRLGVYERVGYKLGAWHDVGWWQFALRDRAAVPEEPLSISTLVGRPGWDALLAAGLPLAQTIRERTH